MNFFLMVAASIAGCGVGPQAVRKDRIDYNEAIIRTFREQMLVNLVRLRYQDSPYFLEISSVSTQYVAGGSADAEATIDIDGTSKNEYGLAGRLVFEERPTITYLPITGEDFANRLLSPLPAESLILLHSSGWEIDRVLRCCVRRVNDLWNVPSTPILPADDLRDYAVFLSAAATMRRLQVKRGAQLVYKPSDNGFTLILKLFPKDDVNEDIANLRKLLDLSAESDEYPLSANPTYRAENEIALQSRSLISVMSFLSRAVDAPQRDIDAARVPVIRMEDGTVFEWKDLTGGLFSIRSSAEPPADAFVRVKYRDTWFYVDDADLNSKATFGLLEQLFNLQAGGTKATAPVLTLPVGR